MRKQLTALLSVTLIVALLASMYTQALNFKSAHALPLTSSLTEPISEFTVPLYVDGFDNTAADWTMVGASPYLDGFDYPNNYISGVFDGETIGSFTFQDVASYDGGKIFIEIYGFSRGPADDKMDIWLYNGTAFYLIGTPTGLERRMGWATTIDVSSYLISVGSINDAKVKLIKRPVGTPDRMEIDVIRLAPEQQIFESHPYNNLATGISVTNPANATDSDGATWASFVYSSATGSFRLHNFTSPIQYPSLNTNPLPDITSVDFHLRYNTSLNTGNLNDKYRIVYYVGGSGPVTLVDYRTDNATYRYVDGFDNTKTGWTRVGASPYLGAIDANYVSASLDFDEIGDFSFQDVASYEGGEVFVEIYATQLVPAADTLDTVDLYLYNQTGGAFLAYTFTPKNNTWGWVTSDDVSSVLDTAGRINGAKAYLVKRTGGIAQTVSVDAVRIKIHNPGYVNEPAALTWADKPDPSVDGVWDWTDINNIRFVVETSAASGTSDHGCVFYEFEGWVTVNVPKAKLHVERVFNNSLLPIPPVTITPMGDAAKGWSTSSGGATHYTLVQSNDGDTSYIYATASNQKDSFGLTDPTAQAWSITTVRIVVYARQTTGDEKLFGYLRVGGLDWTSTASFTPTALYEKYTFDWALNPSTGAAWQWGAQMTNLIAGVASLATGTWSGQLRVTQLYVEIIGSPIFGVDVWAEGALDFWGFSLVMAYNTSVLTAVSSAAYSPFTAALPGTLNDGAGFIAFGYTMPAGSQFGASGNVTSGKVNFIPDSLGYSTLDLYNTKLSNSKAGVIPHMVINTLFENLAGAAPVVDVAVSTVTPSAMLAFEGYSRDVSVDVTNQGTAAATFDVTVFYNGSSMGTQTVVGLGTGLTTALTFTWDTTGVPYGNYTISAYAAGLTFETDLVDNSLQAGNEMMLTIPGDVTGDKTVNVFDILKLKYHRSGPPPGPGGYLIDVDINDDGFINVFDILIAKAHLGQSW